MKTSRIKLKLDAVITRDDAEFCLSEIAQLETSRRRIVADRDAAVLEINQRVQEPLTKIDEAIKAKTSALHAWAEANPHVFPKDRKSLALQDGTIGFRTGNPSVVLASRATNWEKAVATLDALRWRRFLRVKREVDKEALLARYSKLKEAAKKRFETKVLGRLGLKIKQDQTFYVEPNLTELPTRQVEPARTTEAA